MRIKLLTSSDVKQIVHNPLTAHQQLDGDIGLCTIIEVLETAEKARKGKGTMDIPAFLQGWHILREEGGALACGDVQVAVLDQYCLMEDLFQRNEAHVVTGLWPQAVGIDLPPDRTIRRLILRPSERKWWGEEPYSEMESWYEEVPQSDA
jgi:hypothetical protein